MGSKKIRSSNMELLRIVAMLMIIPYHMVCHAMRYMHSLRMKI